MNPIIVVSVAIFVIAVVMAMTGRGGGNFYVPVMIIAGLAMYEAATVAVDFILYGCCGFVGFSEK